MIGQSGSWTQNLAGQLAANYCRSKDGIEGWDRRMELLWRAALCRGDNVLHRIYRGGVTRAAAQEPHVGPRLLFISYLWRLDRAVAARTNWPARSWSKNHYKWIYLVVVGTGQSQLAREAEMEMNVQRTSVHHTF